MTLKLMEEMDYNYVNNSNRFQIHTELGKKIVKLNKVNDMNIAWLGCSEEMGARAIADSLTTYKSQMNFNYGSEMINQETGFARKA